VIAVNQDALGKQATCIQTIGDLRIYAKELEDGSRAVGFCNFGLEKVDISYKDLNKLGISGKQKVRDLWRQKDITTIHADKEALSVKVPVHGVVLYKFTPVK
ncbi:MAG TPA: alpha-galactosidase, partial [Paludibacter sp.]